MLIVVLVWLIVGLLFIAFGLVPLDGAPFLPSLKEHRRAALDLLKLKPGQTVIDLGCGDGRFLKAAAKQGIKAEGYELNPFLLFFAWLNTRRYRKLVKLHLKNFWRADISQADAIYVFLYGRYMARLDKKIKKEAKAGLLVASHTFKFSNKKPIAKQYGVFLYKY